MNAGERRAARKAARAEGKSLDGELAIPGQTHPAPARPARVRRTRPRGKTWEERNADRIDGYDRDDLGESLDR